MTTVLRQSDMVFGAILGLFLSTSSFADWQPDSSDKEQVRAHAALTRFKDKRPQMQSYFEQAHGYAIIPGITRIALGFGLAHGKGLVIEGDELIGWTSYSQLSSGAQVGAKYFSMILFFKDAAALDDYKNHQIRFLAQAGVDLATVGISGTPAYNDGVAIFAITRFGLMAEISYSGARFKYKPVN